MREIDRDEAKFLDGAVSPIQDFKGNLVRPGNLRRLLPSFRMPVFRDVRAREVEYLSPGNVFFLLDRSLVGDVTGFRVMCKLGLGFARSNDVISYSEEVVST